MQQDRYKSKEDTWTTEELTKQLKAMQSDSSSDKRHKERRHHKGENRDEGADRRHTFDQREKRNRSDYESDRHAEKERREGHSKPESKKHTDRERGEKHHERDGHAERERKERPSYPESERHANRERGERPSYPESERRASRERGERPSYPESERRANRERGERPSYPESERRANRERGERPSYPESERRANRERGERPSYQETERHLYPDDGQVRDKAREHHRAKEKSADPEGHRDSGRHRTSDRDQYKEKSYPPDKSSKEDRTKDEKKTRDTLERNKHGNDERERRHREHREKERRKQEINEEEDRDIRHKKHQKDSSSQDMEREWQRNDRKSSVEADGNMRHHKREKVIQDNKEVRSAKDPAENSDRQKERDSQRDDKERRHREKREHKVQRHEQKQADNEEIRVQHRHSRQSAKQGSDDEKEIEETIHHTDAAYEDSTNYEEDFEDYDEDFEEVSEEEEPPSETREQPLIQRSREMEEIQKAILLENENITNMPKSHIHHQQEEESKEVNSSTRKSHRGAFIDFGSAKQRQVSSQVASMQKKRSLEILRLIDLDFSSTFSLLDLAPVKEYEMYIRNFGKTNTKQAYVQCNDDAVDRDIQTEEIEIDDKWTQHPAEGTVVCGGPRNNVEKNGGFTTKVDSQRLSKFLHSAAQVIAVLLEENRAEYLSQSKVQSKESSMSFSESCFHLNTNLPFLQGRDIYQLQFSEAQRHLLLTVHSQSNQSNSFILNDKCLICMWNIWQPSAPQKILVCESKVTCVCFSPGKASLVFAGTVDGSVLVWDLREDFSMHHTVKIEDDNWTFRSVTFSTDAVFTPVNHTHPIKAIEPVPGAEARDEAMSTLSAQEEMSGLSFQLASLDESGHLIFWVVVELRKTDLAGSQSDLGLIPGGKVKLIHSSSIDLGEKFFHRDILSLGIPETLNIKFLPQDSNHFVTGTDVGIVSHGTRYGLIEAPLQYTSLNNKLRPSRVTAIDFSPFGIPAFLAGCSDGCIRLHVISAEYPVMQWNDTTDGQAVTALQWSLTRPAMFFVLDATSCIHVWDLLQNDLQPVAKESKMSDFLFSMSVFGEPEKNNNVIGLALAKSSGKVEIHYIKKKWAKAQPKELEKLQLILQEIV